MARRKGQGVAVSCLAMGGSGIGTGAPGGGLQKGPCCAKANAWPAHAMRPPFPAHRWRGMQGWFPKSLMVQLSMAEVINCRAIGRQTPVHPDVTLLHTGCPISTEQVHRGPAGR